MRIPGIKTAKTFSRWVRARIFGGALILGYHRVTNSMRDVYDVCVSVDHFAEHMEMVHKYARPIHLSKLVRDARDGTLQPKSVAITFDDGYIDTLLNAKPILEKFRIPATTFVCTGYLGGEFWWDELERLVIFSRSGLDLLHLGYKEKSFVWDLSKAHNAGRLDIRRKFCHALYHFLLPLDAEGKKHAMQVIRNWSGIPSYDYVETRSMNHSELIQLADGGLIELGAHTRSHPILPLLTLKQQRDEIVSSKLELEEILGKPVDGFSYPNGKATEETKRIVQDANFVYACTSLNDVVRYESDLYELTRFWQKNIDGDNFLRGLNLWTNL